MKKLKTETRISREDKRIRAQFADISEKKLELVDGLIRRAAFLRVKLEDLEKDIADNGLTEKFSQGKDQTPYDRRRPNADLYYNFNSSYQKTIKQLTDLLPKEQAVDNTSDGFEEFVARRDDG